MNKIYRVVWNETTQTWNAVAEFAKAHGKTASSGIGGIVASAGVRFAFYRHHVRSVARQRSSHGSSE